MLKLAKDKLKQIFGFDSFRSFQEDVISSFLSKNDSLVIMPTGGGKSLCYQLPALIFEGLTIVVSPLIALMKDQVEQLKDLGINAVLLNSSLTGEEYFENITQLRSGEAKILYAAPETLMKPDILDMLSSLKADALVVDEAHCVSEWGHDFRPEYRAISQIRKKLKNAVCMALTATATERVQNDIVKNLKLVNAKIYIDSFDRKNLLLRILPKQNAVSQTLEFLKSRPKKSGIIYCFSRKQADSLYLTLKEKGYSALPYHAGLSSLERNKNQDMFIKDDVQIIVATIAFGMGINKSNIRFIVHFDLPKNIESYYQEIGRAGRDSLKAECLMLFSYGDLQKIRFLIDQKNSEDEKRIARNHLDFLLGFIESKSCRRVSLLNYFGENYQTENCEMCDNCLNPKEETVDITIAAQKFLSCVKRTGEMFGINHIIDILRGSKSQKISNFNHHNLTTYGIGLEFSKNQWRHLARQFISSKILLQDVENFGVLKITPDGYDVLKGLKKANGYIEEEKIAASKTRAEDINYDEPLFNLLRSKRKNLADAASVPPYVVFSDKSLIEMAAYFPQSLEAFEKIHGVGENKLKKYGDTFLAIIIDYCRNNKIAKNAG
ncbi:MAG: DNA helicase RecQ [Spirochaetia bacterium]|nr:DNA helicase RecQ [Spirochaetia bacterium]